MRGPQPGPDEVSVCSSTSISASFSSPTLPPPSPRSFQMLQRDKEISLQGCKTATATLSLRPARAPGRPWLSGQPAAPNIPSQRCSPQASSSSSQYSHARLGGSLSEDSRRCGSTEGGIQAILGPFVFCFPGHTRGVQGSPNLCAPSGITPGGIRGPHPLLG